MKLLIQHDRIAGTAADDYFGPMEYLPEPEDFDILRTEDYRVIDGALVIPPPQSITRAQAIGALILAGLDEQVEPAIESIEDPIQRKLALNDWRNRLHFERSNPTLAMMAAALGLTDEQLDELFRVGANL